MQPFVQTLLYYLVVAAKIPVVVVFVLELVPTLGLVLVLVLVTALGLVLVLVLVPALGLVLVLVLKLVLALVLDLSEMDKNSNLLTIFMATNRILPDSQLHF